MRPEFVPRITPFKAAYPGRLPRTLMATLSCTDPSNLDRSQTPMPNTNGWRLTQTHGAPSWKLSAT